MAFGDSDLAMMLSDIFSVAVSFGATNTRGIVDFYDDVAYDELGTPGVVGRERGVRLLTSEVAALAHGAAITVDGVAYTVRKKLALHADGAATVVFLKP